jgi:hypothetical protein
MDSMLSLVIFAIVFFAMGLLLGLWLANKRGTKNMGTETVIATKRPQTDSGSEKQLPQVDIQSKLDQMSAEMEYLIQYLKVKKGLLDYGSRLHDAYEDFMRTIENEFEALESKEMEGREHVYRSSVLLFSLMMAKVYVQAVGGQWKQDSLPELEKYIERAKRIR